MGPPKVHSRSKHSDEQGKKTSKDNGWWFKCFRCFQAFTSREALNTHVENHCLMVHLFGDEGLLRDLKEKLSSKANEETKTFAQYNEIYASKISNDDRFHGKSSIKHTFKQKLRNSGTCPICHKLFTNSLFLSRHMVVHTGATPYVCTKCSLTFTQSCSLSRHLQTHKEGEKLLNCEFCDNRYRSVRDLNKHLKVHDKLGENGEEPLLKCRVCPCKFRAVRTLRQHEKTHKELENAKISQGYQSVGFKPRRDRDTSKMSKDKLTKSSSGIISSSEVSSSECNTSGDEAPPTRRPMPRLARSRSKAIAIKDDTSSDEDREDEDSAYSDGGIVDTGTSGTKGHSKVAIEDIPCNQDTATKEREEDQSSQLHEALPNASETQTNDASSTLAAGGLRRQSRDVHLRGRQRVHLEKRSVTGSDSLFLDQNTAAEMEEEDLAMQERRIYASEPQVEEGTAFRADGSDETHRVEHSVCMREWKGNAENGDGPFSDPDIFAGKENEDPAKQGKLIYANEPQIGKGVISTMGGSKRQSQFQGEYHQETPSVHPEKGRVTNNSSHYLDPIEAAEMEEEDLALQERRLYASEPQVDKETAVRADRSNETHQVNCMEEERRDAGNEDGPLSDQDISAEKEDEDLVTQDKLLYATGAQIDTISAMDESTRLSQDEYHQKKQSVCRENEPKEKKSTEKSAIQNLLEEKHSHTDTSGDESDSGKQVRRVISSKPWVSSSDDSLPPTEEQSVSNETRHIPSKCNVKDGAQTCKNVNQPTVRARADDESVSNVQHGQRQVPYGTHQAQEPGSCNTLSTTQLDGSSADGGTVRCSFCGSQYPRNLKAYRSHLITCLGKDKSNYKRRRQEALSSAKRRKGDCSNSDETSEPDTDATSLCMDSGASSSDFDDTNETDAHADTPSSRRNTVPYTSPRESNKRLQDTQTEPGSRVEIPQKLENDHSYDQAIDRMMRKVARVRLVKLSLKDILKDGTPIQSMAKDSDALEAKPFQNVDYRTREQYVGSCDLPMDTPRLPGCVKEEQDQSNVDDGNHLEGQPGGDNVTDGSGLINSVETAPRHAEVNNRIISSNAIGSGIGIERGLNEEVDTYHPQSVNVKLEPGVLYNVNSVEPASNDATTNNYSSQLVSPSTTISPNTTISRTDTEQGLNEEVDTHHLQSFNVKLEPCVTDNVNSVETASNDAKADNRNSQLVSPNTISTNRTSCSEYADDVTAPLGENFHSNVTGSGGTDETNTHHGPKQMQENTGMTNNTEVNTPSDGKPREPSLIDQAERVFDSPLGNTDAPPRSLAIRVKTEHDDSDYMVPAEVPHSNSNQIVETPEAFSHHDQPESSSTVEIKTHQLYVTTAVEEIIEANAAKAAQNGSSKQNTDRNANPESNTWTMPANGIDDSSAAESHSQNEAAEQGEEKMDTLASLLEEAGIMIKEELNDPDSDAEYETALNIIGGSHDSSRTGNNEVESILNTNINTSALSMETNDVAGPDEDVADSQETPQELSGRSEVANGDIQNIPSPLEGSAKEAAMKKEPIETEHDGHYQEHHLNERLDPPRRGINSSANDTSSFAKATSVDTRNDTERMCTERSIDHSLPVEYNENQCPPSVSTNSYSSDVSPQHDVIDDLLLPGADTLGEQLDSNEAMTGESQRDTHDTTSCNDDRGDADLSSIFEDWLMGDDSTIGNEEDNNGIICPKSAEGTKDSIGNKQEEEIESPLQRRNSSTGKPPDNDAMLDTNQPNDLFPARDEPLECVDQGIAQDEGVEDQVKVYSSLATNDTIRDGAAEPEATGPNVVPSVRVKQEYGDHSFRTCSQTTSVQQSAIPVISRIISLRESTTGHLVNTNDSCSSGISQPENSPTVCTGSPRTSPNRSKDTEATTGEEHFRRSPSTMTTDNSAVETEEYRGAVTKEGEPPQQTGEVSPLEQRENPQIANNIGCNKTRPLIAVKPTRRDIADKRALPPKKRFSSPLFEKLLASGNNQSNPNVNPTRPIPDTVSSNPLLKKLLDIRNNQTNPTVHPTGPISRKRAADVRSDNTSHSEKKKRKRSKRITQTDITSGQPEANQDMSCTTRGPPVPSYGNVRSTCRRPIDQASFPTWDSHIPSIHAHRPPVASESNTDRRDTVIEPNNNLARRIPNYPSNTVRDETPYIVLQRESNSRNEYYRVNRGQLPLDTRNSSSVHGDVAGFIRQNPYPTNQMAGTRVQPPASRGTYASRDHYNESRNQQPQYAGYAQQHSMSARNVHPSSQETRPHISPSITGGQDTSWDCHIGNRHLLSTSSNPRTSLHVRDDSAGYIRQNLMSGSNVYRKGQVTGTYTSPTVSPNVGSNEGPADRRISPSTRNVQPQIISQEKTTRITFRKSPDGTTKRVVDVERSTTYSVDQVSTNGVHQTQQHNNTDVNHPTQGPGRVGSIYENVAVGSSRTKGYQGTYANGTLGSPAVWSGRGYAPQNDAQAGHDGHLASGYPINAAGPGHANRLQVSFVPNSSYVPH